MHNTGYPEEDLDFRFDWAVTPGATITLASFYVNQDDIARWHRTVDNPGWTHDDHVAAPGRWTEDTYDQERSLTYLRYAGENPATGAPVKRWSATISFQSSDDSEYQNRYPERALANSCVRRQSYIQTDTWGPTCCWNRPSVPGR